MSYRRIAFAAVSLILIICGRTPAAGCVSPDRPTIHQELASCQFIVVGKLENARSGPNGDSTDFVITEVIKSDPAIAGRKVIYLDRYVPCDPKSPRVFVGLGEVIQGKVDIYRGIVATPATADYIKGLLRIDVKNRRQLIRYCFDYLNHEDDEISGDAHSEFAKASEADIMVVAPTLPADPLRRWLGDEQTAAWKLGLYGRLLGHSGNANDSLLLRKAIDKRVNSSVVSTEGLLIGYVMLKPQEGWACLRSLLEKSRPFSVRYAGLRGIRYFRMHPGHVGEKEIVDATGLLLEQDDIADLAIEALREWKLWHHADRILTLSSQKGFDIPIIRRSILRYALQCPDLRAEVFVEKLRESNPQLVKDSETLLKLEEPNAKPGP